MADERILKRCSDGRNGNLILSPTEGFWSNCPTIEVNPEVSAYELFDDFMYSDIGDVTSKWMKDAVNGTVANGSAASYRLGGVVVLSSNSTKNDYVNLKAWDSDNAGGPFKITSGSGKKLWFEAAVYLSSVADEVMYVGLMDGLTTKPFDDDTGDGIAVDGIYFRTLVASPTAVDFATTRNSTEAVVKAAIQTVAATTWYRFGFYFDGVSTVIAYVNGLQESGTAVTVTATTFPYDVGLTPYIGILTGAGADKKLAVDWIKCVQAR